MYMFHKDDQIKTKKTHILTVFFFVGPFYMKQSQTFNENLGLVFVKLLKQHNQSITKNNFTAYTIIYMFAL